MISTVTAITVSTIVSSTATNGTVMGVGLLTLVAIVTLLVFLMEKELFSFAQGPKAKALSFAVNVGLMPLIIAFGIILVTKLSDILSK